MWKNTNVSSKAESEERFWTYTAVSVTGAAEKQSDGNSEISGSRGCEYEDGWHLGCCTLFSDKYPPTFLSVRCLHQFSDKQAPIKRR